MFIQFSHKIFLETKSRQMVVIKFREIVLKGKTVEIFTNIAKFYILSIIDRDRLR